MAKRRRNRGLCRARGRTWLDSSRDTVQNAVMVRNPSLFRAVLLTLAWSLAVALCPAAEPTSPRPNLVGLDRSDVVAVLGRPSGERQRGDTLIMIYPDGTRLELLAGKVVAVSGGSTGEIIGSDGTKYVPGEDGNLQRPVTSGPQTAVPAPDAPAVPAATDETVEGDLPPGTERDYPDGLPIEDLEKFVESMEDPEEEEPESVKKRILALGLEIVFHFGFTVLVLRIAVQVVGVPFFWPDLLKAAVLYLSVYMVMQGLGELGGLWEFIPIFRLDDLVSLIILACSLTWFKVAGSGLTALKIAVATKFVTLGLMLALGLAIAFGLASMQ